MDQQLLYLFNRTWVNPALDWIMASASSLDLWMPLMVLILGLTLVFGQFRGRTMVICLALTLALTDGVFTQSMKKMVGRPRPNDVRNDVRTVDLANVKPRFLALGQPLRIKMARPSDKPVAGNSFPSAHTVNNFAAATVLVAFYRWRGAVLFLVAGLVGYSRIYVGAHYPSDILVSALLGMGEAALLLVFFAAIWRKWAPLWFPKLAVNHPELLA